MKKLLVLPTALSLLILAACGTSDVSTGSEGNSTEKKDNTEEVKKDEESGKTFDASSHTAEVLGMKVKLGEIKIEETKISVGVNLENTTDKVLNFYPDQGSLVVGDMQISANLFLTTGTLGGEVQGGVKQDGVIEYLVDEGKKLDIDSITEVKLIFGDVTTEDFMQSQPMEIVVPVK